MSCGKRSSSFFHLLHRRHQTRFRIEFDPNRPGSLGGQSQRSFFLFHHLLDPLFSFMDKQLIEQALENSGYGLELAIKCLKDLHLGYSENEQVHNDEGGSREECPSSSVSSSDSPVSGAEEWVELLVREMSCASDMNDARLRSFRVLESFEKSIYTHASTKSAHSFHQENVALREENRILKRAVCIQYAREKDNEAKSEQVEQLKQMLRECQEHITRLEVNNYALGMHLKQQNNKSITPITHSNPDVF